MRTSAAEAPRPRPPCLASGAGEAAHARPVLRQWKTDDRGNRLEGLSRRGCSPGGAREGYFLTVRSDFLSIRSMLIGVVMILLTPCIYTYTHIHTLCVCMYVRACVRVLHSSIRLKINYSLSKSNVKTIL